MPASENTSAAFGFFTNIEFDDCGFMGGYLILNCAGRPLEFHCTSPIQANRAQEILYGTTLRPYLFGEQIGQTLYRAAKMRPDLIFTDSEDAATLRQFTDCPVIFVGDVDGDSRAEPFELDNQAVAIAKEHAGDLEACRSRWNPSVHLDLREPFVRITDAIHEARRAA